MPHKVFVLRQQMSQSVVFPPQTVIQNEMGVCKDMGIEQPTPAHSGPISRPLAIPQIRQYAERSVTASIKRQSGTLLPGKTLDGHPFGRISANSRKPGNPPTHLPRGRTGLLPKQKAQHSSPYPLLHGPFLCFLFPFLLLLHYHHRHRQPVLTESAADFTFAVYVCARPSLPNGAVRLLVAITPRAIWNLCPRIPPLQSPASALRQQLSPSLLSRQLPPQLYLS